MPPLKRGDYVAFLDAGGYTESCAARYNAQLLPASVLVSGDRAEIITEREQLKDIAGRFRVPPRLLAASFATAGLSGVREGRHGHASQGVRRRRWAANRSG